MKTNTKVKLMFFLLAAFTLVTSSAAAETLKRYGLKSGVVQYKMQGMTDGSETLYFDNWGMKEAKVTKSVMKMMGVTQRQNQLTLFDEKHITNIDLSTKKGTRIENSELKKFIGAKEGQSYEEIGKEMMKSLGGKQVGTDTVLGKTCEVWVTTQVKTKSCIWKSIPLRVEADMMGMKMEMTAVRLDENVAIAASKFEVPEGVSISDAPKREGQVPNLNELLKQLPQGEGGQMPNMEELMKQIPAGSIPQ